LSEEEERKHPNIATIIEYNERKKGEEEV